MFLGLDKIEYWDNSNSEMGSAQAYFFQKWKLVKWLYNKTACVLSYFHRTIILPKKSYSTKLFPSIFFLPFFSDMNQANFVIEILWFLHFNQCIWEFHSQIPKSSSTKKKRQTEPVIQVKVWSWKRRVLKYKTLLRIISLPIKIAPFRLHGTWYNFMTLSKWKKK